MKKLSYVLIFMIACCVSFYASAKHSCEIKDGRVVCTGDNEHGQCDVLELGNPRQVVVGWHHTCALGEGGVKCWGWNHYGQINVPRLKNPRQVVAVWYHTCALDNDGVKCWGMSTNGLTKVPLLKNPRQVVTGYHHTCALDDDGVKCWGRDEIGITNVPLLKNPRQLVAGYHHTCALDDDGIKCWGRNEYGLTNDPLLKNPRQIVAGYHHTCALDDEGVKCWGKEANLFDLNNTYSEFLVVGAHDGFRKISNNDNAGIANLSQISTMFLPYVFKNELRFFYFFDKLFGEKLFSIFGLHFKYTNLFTIFHSELKKEMGLLDSDEKYRFLWNKDIYLPYGHEFLTEPSAPENDEERKQLLIVLVESIKTSVSLMTDEYKQRASALILELSNSIDIESLREAAEFVTDAGINPYIRPRVKLQMELIRLLGL